MYNEIGGYLELETYGAKFYHDNAIRLNSGRNAFRYALRALNVQILHAPHYTCPSVLEAASQEVREVELYEIGHDLMPLEIFAEREGAFILYNNYFGVCDSNVSVMSGLYKNLIVDNAQSFFARPLGVASFYSPRKFFGLPDGGLLIFKEPQEQKEVIERDTSFGRMEHLLKRHDLNSSAGYEHFKSNERDVGNLPIRKMSKLTEALMQNINYNKVQEIRNRNFRYLHDKIGSLNKLALNCDNTCPMIYPLFLRRKGVREMLISSKIFVAKYWDLESAYNLDLREHLIPLPIDQRYSTDDMKRIVDALNRAIKLR